MINLLLTSSVLILVIIVLRRLLRGRISLRVQYALWLLVALRLLIPVEFGSSPLSLQNFTKAEPATPALVQPSEPVQMEDVTEIPDIPQTSQSLSQPTLTPQTARSMDIEKILIYVWAVGAAGMLLWIAAVNLRFSRKTRKNAQLEPVEGFALQVYVTPDISSSCLLGLLRPKVYLTPMQDPNAKRHVLAHEWTHYRHFDHLWSVVRALCLCIYWFHPLVWWAAALSKRDCELACDEGTLKGLGEDERIAYGRTLLSMLTRANRPRDLLQTATTMSESAKQMKERVEMIVKQPKKLFIALLCLLLVIAVTVGCTFTGAQSKTEDAQPTETSEPAESTQPTVNEPTETEASDPKADVTRDCDFFTIDLPRNISKYSFQNNLPSLVFRSGAKNVVIDIEYCPKIWAKEGSLERFAEVRYKEEKQNEAMTLHGEVATSAAGNLYFRSSGDWGEGVEEHYVVFLEAEHCFIQIRFMAKPDVAEAFLPKFEQWEASIRMNETPSGELREGSKTFDTDLFCLTLGRGFVEVDSSEDFMAINHESAGVWLYVWESDMEASALLLEALNNREDSGYVDASMITKNANGNFCYTEELRVRDYTLYASVLEGEDCYIGFHIEVPSELFEAYRPFIEQWESQVVIK